ncbi:hypothetical protein WJX72_009678 [[Myrmecia] bisecta]|uniref:Oxysterol-binding protein n=1 Tax=[Myrmecia] bisecta TaxID=41462 RepID=A0AAW1QSA7_9CHLO
MPALLKALKRATGEVPAPADEDAFLDAEEAVLHCDAHPDGGFGFTNRQLLASQRNAVMEVIKEAGKSLLTGHLDLISLSLPVKMFESRSYLEKLTDVWVFPCFLDRAAAASSPLYRLQLVATWFIAGQQNAFASWMKPFNPILGETFQAATASGTRVYLEQISHHPPIAAYQMMGPGRAWVLTGVSRPEVRYKGNAVKTLVRGARTITFADGTRMELNFPSYLLKGILYSDQPHGEMDGTFSILDVTHNLRCQIEFGKVVGERNWLLQRPDSFSGQIVQLNAPAVGACQTLHRGSSFTHLASKFASLAAPSSKAADAREPAEEVLSRCVGNWLAFCDWDGSRFWTLVSEPPECWLPDSQPLPSDARYRSDLQQLKQGNLQAAQAAKELLEAQQRTDARWRRRTTTG